MSLPVRLMGKIRQAFYAVQGVNLCAIHLALRRSPMFRTYLSLCLRRYDEFVGHGLPAKNPLAGRAEDVGDVLSVPLQFKTGGGTDTFELLTLAEIAKVFQPKTVFEIGTFNGKTTSVLLLNTSESSHVYTLDLPPTATVGEDYLASDVELVSERRAETFLAPFRFNSRYHQLYCDSKLFDPEPFRDSVDLGFIDGAHTRDFVQNDTLKMAVMISASGLVLWHDYGGKGSFKPLTDYLDGLPIAMYRIQGTSLAWTTGAELKKVLSQRASGQKSEGVAA